MRKKLDDIDIELKKKAVAEPDKWNSEGMRTIKGTIQKVNPEQREVDIFDVSLGLPCIVDVPEKKMSFIDRMSTGEMWEFEVEVFTAKSSSEFRQVTQEIGLENAVKAAGAEEGLDKIYRFVLVGCKKIS